MVEQFILPKDPRLTFAMLLPRFRERRLRSPVTGRATHEFFWARNAIYQGLRALEVKPGENVLVPSYHCTSVVEPILQYGAEAKFYNIGFDLKPDLNEVESKIDPRTRALLAIHYFGFPQPIVEIKTFCRERGLYLIEDCAHVLNGRTAEGIPLGVCGDISIFSWRKFLPLCDGGQLVINNPALRLDDHWDAGGMLFALKIAKNLFDKLLEDSNVAFLNWLGKLSHVPSSMLQSLAGANGYGSALKSVNSYDLQFDLASARLKMSRLSHYIMRNIDLKEVAEARRDNYRVLAQGIEELAAVRPLYRLLPRNVVPWVFPLLVETSKDMHRKLRQRGIPATNWSGVIHPSLPVERFPDSRFLYDNLIFLPVHQSLGNRDLEAMLFVLREVLEEKS